MLIKMIREVPDENGNTYKYVGENGVEKAVEEGWKRADGIAVKTTKEGTKKTKKPL